jgi:hypothetical protein
VQVKFYVYSHHHTFMEPYFMNEVFLYGDWNEIIALETTAAGAIRNYGLNNRFDRVLRPQWGSANQIQITDQGQPAFFDGQLMAAAPPSAGWGYRKGTVLWNRNPQPGQPLFWVNTVDSLGPPQPQGGSWIVGASAP